MNINSAMLIFYKIKKDFLVGWKIMMFRNEDQCLLDDGSPSFSFANSFEVYHWTSCTSWCYDLVDDTSVLYDSYDRMENYPTDPFSTKMETVVRCLFSLFCHR